jgi:N-acyl-phosphatidylethanolamine-hydrolysing phospholipase D
LIVYWFSKNVEAVKIHMDVKSKNSVGIHWATFHMAHEYFLAPKTELAEALVKNNLKSDEFTTMTHGVVYDF